MDPLADMAAIVRNGLMAEKNKVTMPYSSIKEEVLKVLKKEGYINSVDKKEKENKQYLEVGLEYEGEAPKISKIEKISKPGRRIYKKSDELEKYLPYAGKGKEVGRVIVSTSQGVMTSQEAKKKNVGGEVLFKVY